MDVTHRPGAQDPQMPPGQKVAGHAMRIVCGPWAEPIGGQGSGRGYRLQSGSPGDDGIERGGRYSAGWHAPCGRGAGPPRRRRRKEKKITAAPISGR